MRRSPSGKTTAAKSAELERIRAITGSFDDVIRARIAAEPEFADALRQEAMDSIRSGDIATGQGMLRDWLGEDVQDTIAASGLVGAA